MAAIQQKEIDTRADLSDSECLSIVEKQVQLRLEAAEQYQQGQRKELDQTFGWYLESLATLPPRGRCLWDYGNLHAK